MSAPEVVGIGTMALVAIVVGAAGAAFSETASRSQAAAWLWVFGYFLAIGFAYCAGRFGWV